MAIDPNTTITVKVSELASAAFNSTDLVPHEVGGFLKKGTLQDLATFIGSIISVDVSIGFRAVDVEDGETLPATDKQEFILVGPGTYPNVGGGATITTTGSLNALVSNGTFWFIGVEIPINVDAIWGNISGVLSDQTDLWNILESKADLVDGKVPNSQLPSYVDDVVEVANYAALPGTGETGKIYVTIDTGHVYRWSGSAYIRIADESPVWGIITGTLSDQTDLQDALDGKFDVPTGDTTQYIAGDGSLITFPVAGQAGTLVRLVLNNSGATITKGTVVYINGASGNKPTIAKAIATGDATSAQTFGLVQADIANNSTGYVVVSGDLIGLNTSLISEGTQLYLSSTTAGAYTTIKQYAPAHLVYIGIVTRSHPTLGQIEVKIQNGYELDEIHDVSITSKANNQFLVYESATSLWKNKTISTVLGYTPANDDNVVHLTGNESIDGFKTFSSDVKSTAFRLTGGTAGTGLYYSHTNKVVLANYSVGGGIDFETNGGAISMVLDASANLSVVGSVTSSSIIKVGGTSTQFLKADGSVDSSTYASDSLVVKLAGSQTITGSKLFTANTSFQGATIIDYIGGISLKQTGLSLYNQMVAVDGGFNFYENAGTVFSFKIRPEYISFGDSINNAILNASNLTAERTFDLPNASGTIALTSNIPSVSGTTNYIPKFTGASTLGNSKLYEANGTILNDPTDNFWGYQINGSSLTGQSFGAVVVAGTNSSDISFEVRNQAGNASYLKVVGDGKVGIGTSSPGYKLDLLFSNTTDADIFRAGMSGVSNGFEIRRVSSNFRYLFNDGNVGIGTTSPSNGLLVLNSTASNGVRFALESSGTMNGIVSIGSNAISGLATTDMGLWARGAMAFETGANGEKMRITSGGVVLVNTTSLISNDAKMEIKGDSSNYCLYLNAPVIYAGVYRFQRFYANGSAVGDITSNGSSTSYNTTSDYRLKQDLKPINGLDLVSQIKVYDYEWKSDQTRSYGVLAHELQEVIPQAVNGEKDGEQMQGVDYSKLVPILVQAIQEQQKQIEELKTLINK